MKLTLLFLAVFFISFLSCKTSYAQNSTEKVFTARSSESGELTILHLEQLRRDFKTSTERLFVIAHLGNNEISSANYRRLALTRAKLFSMSFDDKRLVFAEGEKVKGEGRIEFYLGSELRMILLAKRNQMPNLTCCPDYFPPVKNKRKNRRNKYI